jgi:hypothetical protein
VAQALRQNWAGGSRVRGRGGWVKVGQWVGSAVSLTLVVQDAALLARIISRKELLLRPEPFVTCYLPNMWLSDAQSGDS